MKKTKKRRIISIIAIVCIMLTMFNGTTISVNAVTTTDVSNEAELKAAITNASDGDRINITSDITISSEVAISGKSITIEGNNHIIKVPVTGLDESGIYNVGPSTFRVFDVAAIGKTVEIDNLTVKCGGKEGILNNIGTVLKLTNVNISNSNNYGGGGAIINFGGTVYLKNNDISRNAASSGGGFLNKDSYYYVNPDQDEFPTYFSGKMFIENCTFSENRSTSLSGGGGAGENQGELYANNSTFSNNKSTELGGAINNLGGTTYIVNSTFTGNVAYGSFGGGAIANNSGTVKTLNSLFAYNYRNSGTQSVPSYSLNDIYVYEGNKIDSYCCLFQDANYETYKSSNSIGNILYYGAADGSDNCIFTNGVNSKVLGPDGKEIGSATIFQPLLAKVGGSITSPLLQVGSAVLSTGIKTSFTNGNGTPSIGYYNGLSWISLIGTADGSNEVTVDQNNIPKSKPTVGSVVTTASDIYLLKVNAAKGGTVVGGTIYGDAYAKDTIVNITAIPSNGYHFSRWEYADGGTGTASTSKSFSVKVTENITLKPVFTAIPDATFTADIIAATNTEVNVTINYPAGSVVNQYSLDGTNYNAYTGPIKVHANGKVYAKSQDTDGTWSNVSEYNVTNIDKILPVLSVSGNSATWTSNDVTLSVSASDTESGLHTGGAYSFDGGSTWTTSNTKSFSSNGTVNIMVRDNAGNLSAQNTVIDKIDKASPTFSNITKTPTGWTADNVTLTIKEATDNGGSGLNSTPYSFSTEQGEYNWQASNVSSSYSQNQTIYVYIRDALGNVSDASIVNITNIDNTLPLITGVTGNPTDWTGNNVTLTVNANDNVSGLAAEAYSFDGGTTWQSENTKTYDENTDGVAVKVKDNAGNIAAYDTINITKIDKTAPNEPVIVNNDKYTENKWFNENQTITASFIKTEGCDEKLQYKVDDSAWTDGESAYMNSEGKHVVSFRVMDNLDRTSEVQTVKVNIDKTAPTNAKITVKDKDFTSFLNTITFGLFFKETVGVTIAADCNISGIDKIEYQKVSDKSDYDPDGTWIEGDSFSVSPDQKFIVYAKITDNAKNYVIINSDGVIVDATKPALSLRPDTSNWTKNNVNVKVTTADTLAGIKELTYTTDGRVPQTGTLSIVNGEGTITLTNEGQYKLTVTAKDNSLNEISESADIKIDRTKPIITGVGNCSNYFIGRVIKLTDNIGEIAEATYKDGTGTDTSFKDGDLFEKAGNYTLNLIDKAGNSNTLSFEIKVLPKVENVVYTAECKVLIDSIRDEFISHNDLPELYKTDVDNEIKALENRYFQLDKEVVDMKTETNIIKGKVEKLPNGVDGLLNLQKEIQDEYNRITGDRSTLTQEEKKALEKEEEYLKEQLNIIVTLQNQVKNIKTQVSNIDTKEEGLISQEGKITVLLGGIGELTKEQLSILKPQSDLLNSLLNQINTLKDQVKTVKEMMNSLPTHDKITKQDSEDIIKIYKLYSELINEQKELLGEDYIKQFNDILEVLKKIMLYDAETDLTVTNVDGASFTPDIYLIVKPINADTDEAKLKSRSKDVEEASKHISELEGKELLALYDVSLFRDNIKIQPDGNVRVKIRIPEELRKCTDFDIVHIADNGAVTSMNAALEDNYLVFTTNHFSEYAIVAKAIIKEIPKTGSVVDFNSLIIVGILFNLIGFVLIRKKVKRV